MSSPSPPLSPCLAEASAFARSYPSGESRAGGPELGVGFIVISTQLLTLQGSIDDALGLRSTGNVSINTYKRISDFQTK